MPDHPTTNPDVLRALADRCEREEPSRDLDDAIWSALHPPLVGGGEELPDDFGEPPLGFGFESPAYTTSLDAAVTLVPDEYKNSWSAGDNSGEHQIFGRLGYEHEATGLTPALALCAAALRARSTLSEKGE